MTVCRVAIFKLMKSPKALESAATSCPLVAVVVVVGDVSLDSFRSWTLEDFVTAAEFDCRCEGNVSLRVMCSDVVMSREAWKRSRL